jgi:general secretion pathway protein A
MYEAFYGLTADPFRLSVESGFCFPHRSYARAKAYVEYALHRAEGFVMITGVPGTGKTTLVNDLLEHLPKQKVVTATLVSTQLEADDLLRMTAYGFGLESQSPRKSQVLQRLMEFFAQLHQQGLRTLLIIDEAQDLAPTALEELRLLTNLQRAGQPLLQIVLLGQESLADLLRRRELEQVHQRLIAAWQLEPLDLKETIGYVRYRLERAGWYGDPAFEPGVLKLVHEFSEGIPRRINLICSRLLLHGCISELHTLTTDDARALIEELRRERLAAREGETASDDLGGNPLGVTQPATASPEPAGEDPDEIDQGLTGPAAPANPPAASPAPTEPPPEDPPAPVAESAPGHSEPAAGAPPPEGPPEQTEPPVPSEQSDEEPTPRNGIRADQDADRSATPGLHWQYVPEPDEAAPTTHDLGEVPRHPRRAGWIKALLLLGALFLLALALSYPVHEDSVRSVAETLQEKWNNAVSDGRNPPGPIRESDSVESTAVVPEPAVGAEPRTAIAEPGADASDAPAPDRELGSSSDRPEPMPAETRETLEDPPTGAFAALPPTEAAARNASAGSVDVAMPTEGTILAEGRVFFDVNDTEVGTPFEALLDEMADALKGTDDAYAEIVGFTDRFGDPDYNRRLSGQRAQSVANQLVVRGIAMDRLRIEGRGTREPNLEVGAALSREEARVVKVTVRTPPR